MDEKEIRPIPESKPDELADGLREQIEESIRDAAEANPERAAEAMEEHLPFCTLSPSGGRMVTPRECLPVLSPDGKSSFPAAAA